MDDATPHALLLAAQMLLMVSLAALFTPSFTLGLGRRGARPYSHGSTPLAPPQQVAAAMGAALTVTVTSWRTTSLTASGVGADEAFAAGVRLAFGVSATPALVVVVMARPLPNRPAGVEAGLTRTRPARWRPATDPPRPTLER